MAQNHRRTPRYIDELVDAKLKNLRIEPTGVCTDEEILRRAYLDIIGVPPTIEEYQKSHGRQVPRQTCRPGGRTVEA